MKILLAGDYSNYHRALSLALRRMGQGRIFVLELPYNSIRGLGYFLRLFFAFACNAARIFFIVFSKSFPSKFKL